MEWKFKVGDVVSDGIHEYQVTELGNRGYFVRLKNKSSFVPKGLLESCATLVEPKSLFEQALELVNLKIGDEFMFSRHESGAYKSRYKFSGTDLYVFRENVWIPSGFNIGHVLDMPQNIVKVPPLKSEAELILDELQKVVDKANEVLKRGV